MFILGKEVKRLGEEEEACLEKEESRQAGGEGKRGRGGASEADEGKLQGLSGS
jgi:hypothetical protein